MNELRGRNPSLPVCNLEAAKLLSFMAFMTEGQLLSSKAAQHMQKTNAKQSSQKSLLTQETNAC